jgi:bla regulator protein blaR1
MATWSQSLFLQALGWATLNSFWQMALLWCCILLVTHFFRLSSNKKYLFSAYSVLLGFAWFIYTFFAFYMTGNNEALVMQVPMVQSFELLPVFLTSASVTYLALLIIPTFKVFRNWRFIQQIKRHGLDKAPYAQRLFVQKISSHLGIKKRVNVYLSNLVSSPVTVGYLKPIILIPVAALNHLTTQQVEAILLHELSHIRRHDYLVNLLLTMIHVVLYFNPFVKLFIRKVEIERENCCDEMVLQFQYDRISYATALLELEKSSQSTPVLAIGAADKKHLLNRIEKIVGIHKKQRFNTSHFAGALFALVLLFMVNSFIIADKKASTDKPLNYFSEPYSFFANEREEEGIELKPVSPRPAKQHTPLVAQKERKTGGHELFSLPLYATPELESAPEPPSQFIQVAADDIDASLDKNQKEQVKQAITSTKKLLETQWKEVEQSIADGMTSEEKEAAKEEYMKEIERVNWQNIEQNLKAEYEKIDWEVVNHNLEYAKMQAKMDSLEQCYNKSLADFNKLNKVLSTTCPSALPDLSIQQVEKAKADVKLKLEQVKKLKVKKVVSL